MSLRLVSGSIGRMLPYLLVWSGVYIFCNTSAVIFLAFVFGGEQLTAMKVTKNLAYYSYCMVGVVFAIPLHRNMSAVIGSWLIVDTLWKSLLVIAGILQLLEAAHLLRLVVLAAICSYMVHLIVLGTASLNSEQKDLALGDLSFADLLKLGWLKLHSPPSES